jgi:tRNA (mo5U34)-methyltransferase
LWTVSVPQPGLRTRLRRGWADAAEEYPSWGLHFWIGCVQFDPMDVAELQEKVDGFERWHYPIDLGRGVVTPAGGPNNRNRIALRKRIFFDRLLMLTGGTLKGLRVLDLGCNAGYWSLSAIEAGADFVFGIDGRQMHIDQANLVFEAKEIDRSRYQFELGNFLKYPFGSFDVVFCLGVLYHVSSPVELFDVMAATGAELLVIDTEVSNLGGNVIALFTESVESARNAVEEELVGYPTRGAISLLARKHGYQIAALSTECVTDWSGLGGRLKGTRAAFICSKTLSLDALPRQVASSQSGTFGERVRSKLSKARR